MCGISGLIGNFGKINEFIELSNNFLRTRGPDNFSYSHNINSSSLFCHTRLSIIDINERANQPFKVHNSDLVICFNGSISNFRRLANLFDQNMNTRSDTEVLLHAYLRWGISFLKYLEGMFAICIYDPVSKNILLARDHTGIKPLYYYQDDNNLIFCSEIKPIIQHPKFQKDVNKEVILEYFSRGFVSAPDTMIKGIKQLPPGHFAITNVNKRSDISVKSFWNAHEQVASSKKSVNFISLDETLEQLIVDSFHADVDVGVQLSGGIDSSLISYYDHKQKKDKLKTYSVIFDDSKRYLSEPKSEDTYISFLSSEFNLSNKN